MKIFLTVNLLLSFWLSVSAQNFTTDYGKCRISVSDKKSGKITKNEPEANEIIVNSSSGRFTFHYYTSGTDSLSFSDNNSNSINDYIDTALVEIETIFEIEVLDAGLTTTYLENIHIYFKNIGSGYYGQTINDPEGFIGSNPYRSKAYIEINSKVEFFDVRPIDMIRVTLAHEFQHVLHMKYGFWVESDSDPYFLPFYEMAATFFEESLYDSVNDYYFYLRNGPFDNPQSPPFYRSYDYSKIEFMYGSAIFFIYMQDLYGEDFTRQYLADVTKNLTEITPWIAAKSMFNQYYNDNKFDRSFDRYFNQYALALSHTGNHPLAGNFFSEGMNYPSFDTFSKNANTINLLPANQYYMTVRPFKAGYANYWLRYDDTDYPLIFSNADFEYYSSEGKEVLTDSVLIQIMSFAAATGDELPFKVLASLYSGGYDSLMVRVFNSSKNELTDIPVNQIILPATTKQATIFPNPLNFGKHDYFAVRLEPSSSFYTINLYDLNGKNYLTKIASPSAVAYNLPIILQELPNSISSGIYLVSVESSRGIQLSKIMVIR